MTHRIYYIPLRALSSVRHAISRWFTPAGKFVLAGLVATAVIGLDTNKNVAYQAFTFLAALLLVSFIANRFFTADIALMRDLPRFGTVGQALPYRLHLRVIGRKPLRGLLFRENLADPRPALAQFRKRVEIAVAQGSRWTRDPWYLHWGALVRANQPAEAASYPLPALEPGNGTELRVDILPLKRGRLRFTTASFSRTDPFGLLNTYLTVPSEQSIPVLPKRYPLPDIRLPGTRAYQHGGVSLSTSVADSEEFQSLREYRPGDPVRLIHWKSAARAGKPVIREYQDEFFVRHALVLDTFMTTDRPDLFEEAVSVAASFACTVQTQESLLDLMFVGDKAYCETAGRGQGLIEHLLEVLAGVQVCRDKPFSVLHRLVVSRRFSLSGCVCILLAWDEARKEFISHLNTLGVPTMVIVLTDNASFNLPESDERPAWLHALELGKIEEGLARL